jgi:hypothetical protein
MVDTKKYNCNYCKFYTNNPTEWIIHMKSKKHERLGNPKSYNCPKCTYKALNNWNLTMHTFTNHATKEERAQYKYYCPDCDKVFFCNKYYNTHMETALHKNRILANKYLEDLNKMTANNNPAQNNI